MEKKHIPVEDQFDFKIENPDPPITLDENNQARVMKIINKSLSPKKSNNPPLKSCKKKRRKPKIATRTIRETKKNFY